MPKKQVEKAKVKFEFDNEGQYLVAKYKEQLEFALFQVQSQYDSAKKREMTELNDIKAFGSALLAIILALPIGILIAISGGMIRTAAGFVFGLFGALIVFVDFPFLLYALPLCLFKVLRGFILLQISKRTKFGLWICEKWNIQAFGMETKVCEDYIRKYKLILEEIEELREELELSDEVDLSVIKRRMANVDTKPAIPVTNSMYGRINQKIKKVSVYATVFMYIMLAILFFRFYGLILSELTYMFHQF